MPVTGKTNRSLGGYNPAMSDAEDLLTPAAPTTRVGSNADLARRMDRIEGRQDTMETEVRTLSATVSRVELNQQHATELAKLRFDAIEHGLGQISTEFKSFSTRIEGVLSGEIILPAARQGQELVADYKAWRKEVDDWREERDNERARNAGVSMTFSGGKAVILTVAAVVGPIVALVALITR